MKVQLKKHHQHHQRHHQNDIDIQYLSGVGKHADGLITLLNIATVIVEKENDKA